MEGEPSSHRAAAIPNAPYRRKSPLDNPRLEGNDTIIAGKIVFSD